MLTTTLHLFEPMNPTLNAHYVKVSTFDSHFELKSHLTELAAADEEFLRQTSDDTLNDRADQNSVEDHIKFKCLLLCGRS